MRSIYLLITGRTFYWLHLQPTAQPTLKCTRWTGSTGNTCGTFTCQSMSISPLMLFYRSSFQRRNCKGTYDIKCPLYLSFSKLPIALRCNNLTLNIISILCCLSEFSLKQYIDVINLIVWFGGVFIYLWSSVRSCFTPRELTLSR